MFEKILIIGFENSFKMKQMKFIYKEYDYEIISACHVKDILPLSDKMKRRSPECRPDTQEFYNKFQYQNRVINCAFAMTPLECACCLSHIKANEQIINKNLENTLILEDDAYPTPFITMDLQLPKNYDYILLHNKNEPGYLRIEKGHGDSAVAYLVKNKLSAQKYINFFNKGLMCSDSPFSFPEQPFEIYKTTKNLFYHDITFSYLSKFISVEI